MRTPWALALLAYCLVAAFPLAADPWGETRSHLIPSTLADRLDPKVQNLLFLTPAAQLRPVRLRLSPVDGHEVTFVVRKVRSGPEDQTLWELRLDVGRPYSAGCWIVFRDGLDRIREVRLILTGPVEPEGDLLANTGTWIRLTPKDGGPTSRMDLFVAGRLVWGGWQVPTSLSEILKSPEQSLWDSTAQEVPWSVLIPQHTPADDQVEQLARLVEHALSTVPETRWGLWVPDPHSDAQGTDATGKPWGLWTSLENYRLPERGLGPWGSTAWLTDSLCRAWKIPVPRVEDLLRPQSHLPGYSPAAPGEQPDHDPSLSLDWIRNLGLTLAQGLAPDRKLASDGADVLKVPFLDAEPQTGFNVDDLGPVLELLTALHPGRIYFAGLNQQVLTQGMAGAVRFLDPAILFPWVGKDGNLRLKVISGTKAVPWQRWLGPLGQPAGRRADHILLVAVDLPPEGFPLLKLP